MFRFILCLLMAAVFAPLGVFILQAAFSLNNPQVFVMFIFSGSLMVLLGLTGILGAWFGRPGRKINENSDRSEEL